MLATSWIPIFIYGRYKKLPKLINFFIFSINSEILLLFESDEDPKLEFDLIRKSERILSWFISVKLFIIVLIFLDIPYFDKIFVKSSIFFGIIVVLIFFVIVLKVPFCIFGLYLLTQMSSMN